MQEQLENNQQAIANTRDELEKFNTQLDELATKYHASDC